jgi:hypothetical protein
MMWARVDSEAAGGEAPGTPEQRRDPVVITAPNWSTVIAYVEESARRAEYREQRETRRAVEQRRALRQLRSARPR